MCSYVVQKILSDQRILNFHRCSLDLPLATVKIGDAFLVLDLVFRLIFYL